MVWVIAIVLALLAVMVYGCKKQMAKEKGRIYGAQNPPPTHPRPKPPPPPPPPRWQCPYCCPHHPRKEE